MSGVKKKALFGGAMAALVATSAFATGALALDPGYRALDAEHTLVIDTTKGRIIVEMYPELAPNHVERLTTLTRQHFYDNLIFHRVIEDFMDQTGDPKGSGEGGSTLPDLKAEFTFRHDTNFPLAVATHPSGSMVGFIGAMPIQSQVNELAAITKDGKTEAWGLYCQGTLGMAHSYDPNSGNSQFFLMRGANSSLEQHYTAFGTVVSGMDVVRKMKIGEPPVNPDKMTKVQILADMPAADRPNLEVMDTHSTQFQAILDKTRKDKGVNFSACDVTVPAKIVGAADTTTNAPPPLVKAAPSAPTAPPGQGND